MIPGSLLYSSDSEGDIDPVAVDDPQVFETKTALSLQEILEQLALKINDDKISKFNISRSHLWEGALRGLRRKTFSPDNRVSVKFTDESGTSEGAVDLGGPKRVFFTLVLEWIVNSQLFCGPEESKFLSCNANYLGNAGEFIAMSIVHGGPGPRGISSCLIVVSRSSKITLHGCHGSIFSTAVCPKDSWTTSL